MAPQNERDGLIAAWRALSGVRDLDGWQTIPVRAGNGCRFLAGRHFPGNEEALLVGFRDAHKPSDDLMPQGHGFLVTGASPDLSDGDWCWLALSRKQEGNLELFEMMASDLVTLLSGLSDIDGHRLLEVFLARVATWQEFMLRDGRRLLGPEAEVGLYGELELLDALISLGIPAPLAVDAWQGPLNGLHDFRFGAGAIEVKTSASPASFQAKVGGLEQLDDSLVSPLYLAGIRLVTDEHGKTLPGKIDELRGRLSDLPATGDFFDRLLMHAGFSDQDSESYQRRFRCMTVRVFPVNEDFPRLVRSSVPGAVTSAMYEIDLLHDGLAALDLEQAVNELGVIS